MIDLRRAFLDMDMRRLMRVCVPKSLLPALMTGGARLAGIPDKTRVIEVVYEADVQGFTLVLQNCKWPVLKDGTMVPVLSCEVQTLEAVKAAAEDGGDAGASVDG